MSSKARNKPPARTFTLIKLKGFLMETEHTPSAVQRAYAFVEDMFGLQHEGQTREDPEDPDAYTFQTVGEVSQEMRRRHDGE
jgi:hypothetical protein